MHTSYCYWLASGGIDPDGRSQKTIPQRKWWWICKPEALMVTVWGTLNLRGAIEGWLYRGHGFRNLPGHPGKVLGVRKTGRLIPLTALVKVC